ncbi:hypothetical protein TNCV_450531 [Trichonephila clavipes]|nr:hypothetical protein TNCV_450531 [Trichonephila clavipes]
MTAIGDGPRNFVPRSSDKNNTSAGTLPPSELPHYASERTLSWTDLTRIRSSTWWVYSGTRVRPHHTLVTSS